MQTEPSTGTFLFSLDTELVWGYFDLDDERERLFSKDGSRERRSIRQILDLMDEFDIRATWAVVGGMMYDRWEPSASRPVEKWEGHHRAYDQIHETDNPAWYGADVIGWLLEKSDRHEIGCHGFTHTPFPDLSEDEARIELESWIQAAARYGIKPKTMIFPRNQVDHLPLLREAGFTCYRGKKVMAPIYTNVPVIGKVYNRLDLFFQFAVPQVYQPSLDDLGMANLPESQWVFRINRKLETTLDAMNLHRMRLRPMIQGIKKAAAEKKVIHLWAHPWEFRTDKDVDKLRALFSAVQDEVKSGRLRSVTMGEMADELLGK